MKWTFLCPEHKEGTLYLPVLVRRIVYQIDGCGSAVVLADAVKRGRLAKAPQIFTKGGFAHPAWRAFARGLSSKPEQKGSEEVLGAVSDHRFGEWSRLNHKEPMVKRGGELLGDVLIEHIGRHDVENREPGETIGVIEGHPVRDAAAAVMPHQRKLPEPQMLHDFNLVLSHGTLRIGSVILAFRRLAAVAVAPKVRDHQSEVLGKIRRHLAPQHIRLRDAVQEQHRRTFTAVDQIDGRPARL